VDEAEVRSRITAALRDLFERDHELLHRDVNERSITHKLACYLGNQFPDYDVDCEYNRDGLKPKRLRLFVNEMGKLNPDDIDAVTVYPDIIVHRRGVSGAEGGNLLVIEAKKENVRTGYDAQKLKCYKRDLSYQYAFLVIFPMHRPFPDPAWGLRLI
jgi:hypothetical protein